MLTYGGNPVFLGSGSVNLAVDVDVQPPVCHGFDASSGVEVFTKKATPLVDVPTLLQPAWTAGALSFRQDGDNVIGAKDGVDYVVLSSLDPVYMAPVEHVDVLPSGKRVKTAVYVEQ